MVSVWAFFLPPHKIQQIQVRQYEYASYVYHLISYHTRQVGQQYNRHQTLLERFVGMDLVAPVASSPTAFEQRVVNKLSSGRSRSHHDMAEIQEWLMKKYPDIVQVLLAQGNPQDKGCADFLVLLSKFIRVITVERNEPVFTQGTPGKDIFFVLEGAFGYTPSGAFCAGLYALQ